MNCNGCQEQIPLMQAGLLTEAETSAVRDHLNDCPDCRKTARLEGRITDTLDGMFADLPEPCVPLPTRNRRSLWRLTPIRAGLAAAAVGLVAVVLSLVLWEGRIDVQHVVVQSPVRDVAVLRAEFRAPVVREAGDMLVQVDQLKKNIVWVSIQN